MDCTCKLSIQRNPRGNIGIEALMTWTRDEDNLLRNAVRIYGVRRWNFVASTVPNHSEHSCSARWDELQNRWTAHSRQPWTSDEDNFLRNCVDRYGARQWTIIASFLPGRTSKQCRERWHNQLNPSIKHDAWSKGEDELLVLLHRKFGNAWSRIASLLPGRTDNAIKNRWHSARLRRRKREKNWDSLKGEDEEQVTDDGEAQDNPVQSPPREVLAIADELFARTNAYLIESSAPQSPAMEIIFSNSDSGKDENLDVLGYESQNNFF